MILYLAKKHFQMITQSAAEAVEYTDWFSAEG